MFDAGAIQAHLDVTLTEFDRKLTQAEERVKRFEDAKHEVKITAKIDNSEINQVRQQFTRLDQAITRDAAQRAKTSQGSLLHQLATAGVGGRVAGGLSKAPLLLGAGLAALPALGTLGGVGLGAGIAGAGAFAAGGAALGAFGAIAKPVLADALKAEKQVKTAQDAYNQALASGANRAKAYAAEQQAIAKAYGDMSPAQRVLSQQLGKMAETWEKVKKAETPVVAGALQPWLKSITDMMTKLHPIVVAVSGVLGSLGKQFDVLVNSPTFTKFRDFVAGTGSRVVGEGGRALLDFLQGMMNLLPLFAPLIKSAADGLGSLGDKFLAWSQSDKARADVAKFLQWFHDNGPSVGRFIGAIGGALKNLAPGLTAGGALELQVLTTFLDLVAKMPPGVAGPLAAVAGAALILAKLPGGTKVISFAVNVVGKGAKALLDLADFGIGKKTAKLDVGAAGMQTAADTNVTAAETMLAASENNLAAAGLSKGGAAGGAAAGAEGAAGAEAGAAGGAAAGGGIKSVLGKLLGRGTIGGAVAVIGNQLADLLPAGIGRSLAKVGADTASGAIIGSAFGPIGTAIGAVIGAAVGVAMDPKLRHAVMEAFDWMRHHTAVVFDGIRHDIADYWNVTFADTIGTIIRFGHNVETQFNSVRHEIAVIYDGVRHDTAHIWDIIWNNTIAKVIQLGHDIEAWFARIRHQIAVTWDGARHDTARIWDIIYNNTIGAAIRLGRGLYNTLDGWWHTIVRNVWNPVRDFMTKTVPGWWQTAVQAISGFWGKLGGIVKVPVNFLIGTVYDNGIRRFWNAVVSKIPGIGDLPLIAKLATGGRIPGYGGGDRHLSLLEGGEAVVSKEVTAAHASDLSSWGVPGFQHGGKVGQAAPHPPVLPGAGSRFGPIPGVAGVAGDIWHILGKVWDVAKIAGDVLTGNTKGAANAMNDLIGVPAGTSGPLEQMMLGIPRRIVKGLIGLLAGAGSASASSIVNYAMSFLGKIPYVWGGTSVPGGADCSGFIQAIYGHFGIGAPRTSEAQGAWVKRGPPSPGGLAFYHSPPGGPDPGHVALVKDMNTVISQGGGMGPKLMGLHGMPLLWTGVPPGGLRGLAGGATPGAMSPAAIAALWIAQGGPRGAAANMARIANAESGDVPGAIQKGQPPGLTGYGLYQITPTSGIWQNGAYGNLLNAANNTRAALFLYRGSGYQPWAADPVGGSLVSSGLTYAKGGMIREPVIGFGTATGMQYTLGENGPEWVSPAGPGGGPAGGAMIGSVHIQLPEGQTVANALSELNFWLNVAKQQGFAGVLPGA